MMDLLRCPPSLLLLLPHLLQIFFFCHFAFTQELSIDSRPAVFPDYSPEPLAESFLNPFSQDPDGLNTLPAGDANPGKNQELLSSTQQEDQVSSSLSSIFTSPDEAQKLPPSTHRDDQDSSSLSSIFTSHDGAQELPPTTLRDDQVSSSLSSIFTSTTTRSPGPISTQHHVETPPPTVPPQLVIRKCCPLGEVFSHQHAGCVQSSDWTFSVPIFTLDQFGGFVETNVTRNQVAVRTGLLKCDQQFQLDVYPEQEPSFQFRVLESGWLWVPEYNLEYRPEHYCLETFVQDAADPESPSIMGGAVCVLPQEQPHTFDPDKVPVRKCCHLDMVYQHSEFNCVPRTNLTEEPWLVPLAAKEGGPVELLDLRRSRHGDTHEVVPDFQTCSGDQRGVVLQRDQDQFFVRAADGFLWLPPLHRFLPPGAYCLEDFYAQEALLPSVYACLSEEEAEAVQQIREPGCQKEPCLPKCCPRHTSLDRALHACVPEQSPPPALLLHHANGTAAADTASSDYNIGFPSCGSQYLTARGERAQLLMSGDLRYVSINADECQPEQVFRVPKGDFCIERVEDMDGFVTDGAVLCFKDDWRHLGITGAEKNEVNYIYSVFLGISDFFILVSFVVYLTVPDQTQRGLNKNIKLAHSILGRILLCFLFSLFFAYLCLIIAKTASDPINLADPRACIALGVCTYVFFMATFFWLNVLCFELWWKCARQEGGSGGRRWTWYRVYGWCCPLVFGAVALGMELTPGVSNCYIKPKFGTYSCFFSFTKSHNNGAKWAYFFGPVAVLLLTDLVFFILTVRSLLHTVKQSHMGTAQRQARQRLRLCFKLFLVMGISWLAEIISFQLGPRTVWYISDVINCFQGFIIFLIFILKPKILEAVRSRLCRCCGAADHSKTRGTLNFTSFMLSDQTTSVSVDYDSSVRGPRDFVVSTHVKDIASTQVKEQHDSSTSSRAKSFGSTQPKDFQTSRGSGFHPQVSPASSSSSSLSARSVKWRNLESRASYMPKCMMPEIVFGHPDNEKPESNHRSESSFGSASTTLSSTRSTDSSSGRSPSSPHHPLPLLTLSASILNSQFSPTNDGLSTLSTQNTSSRKQMPPKRHSSSGSLVATDGIIPIPRPRSTLQRNKDFGLNRPVRGERPPAIPPRPSLGETSQDRLTYHRSRSYSGGVADLEV